MYSCTYLLRREAVILTGQEDKFTLKTARCFEVLGARSLRGLLAKLLRLRTICCGRTTTRWMTLSLTPLTLSYPTTKTKEL